MKDIKVIKAKGFLLDLISQGEHEQQDFKYVISDARKIARSISAFANNSGGRLLVGVKDNGRIAGLRNEEDIFVIEQAAQLYCVPEQEVEFTAYSGGDAGIVICATVPKAFSRPICVKEADGKLRAYFRVADENIMAHPLMVKAWRLQASGRNSAIGMYGAPVSILDALRTQGPMTIERAVFAARVTERTAHDAIVRLAAMGLVQFTHTDTGFLLSLCP